MRRLIWVAVLSLAPALYAQEHGGGHEEPGIGWKWANFAMLVAVLGYLCNKHLPAFFQSRTAEIQSGLKEAAKMREDAERQVADIGKRVANLEAEIQNMRQQAMDEMNAEAGRIQAETTKTISRIQNQASIEIASATKLASQELRQKAADLAVQLAAAQIRERMSPGSQEMLVSSFISQIGSGKSR